MQFTAGQAAKAAAVNTATITRAIKRGRLSAQKGHGGAWKIEAAELLRVYPRATPQETPALAVQNDAISQQDSDLRFEVAKLEERLRAAEALREMADEMRAAAERDRDSWRSQVERLTHALPAPAAKVARPERRHWWTWR